MPTDSSAVMQKPDRVASLHSGQQWKLELQQAITDTKVLLDLLELPELATTVDNSNPFALRVPQSYLRKIRRADPHDPLLLQVLPQLAEHASTGQLDPVADLNFMHSSGLLHKYHGRALMITTGACAIHCRYCFRRHYPYSDASISSRQLADTLVYLQQHTEIDEIILSGGDPLMLDDARLFDLIQQLENIEHLRYLRIHSRLPVVLPSRINPALLDGLQQSRFKLSMVIHCNHANEIADDETRVLQQLHHAGISLLNQSVLLKGINDDADNLIELSKRLYDSHVLPYYLHMLDPVQGAMHFDVGAELALAIVESMRASLPGYLVPRLVREIPNSASKTAISAI
jgi:EF-P beta-lysylation protein EpmB